MKCKWIAVIFLTTMSTLTFAEDEQQYVPTEHITKHTGDSYEGPIDVEYHNEFGKIHARLETQNLILVSLTADQLENYVGLFTDPDAVAKYRDGQPWDVDKVERMVQKWVARWEENRDPFSAFAIFEKKAGTPFIGHIALGHGLRYGQAEMAFLFKPASRNIWYATQAVTAVLDGYVPRLVDNYCLVNLDSSVVEPSPLRSIHATGHFDDTFSGQAMIRSGMSIAEEDIFWGAQRFHYLVRVDEILSKMTPVDHDLYDTGD
jgi:RimJ/RimL family protein N-acetyltransferase